MLIFHHYRHDITTKNTLKSRLNLNELRLFIFSKTSKTMERSKGQSSRGGTTSRGATPTKKTSGTGKGTRQNSSTSGPATSGRGFASMDDDTKRATPRKSSKTTGTGRGSSSGNGRGARGTSSR
jgi:hypothetical protein